MFHDNPQQDVSDLFRNYQQRQDNYLITGLSGASRVQLCAICRQPGHNSANCPQKENDPDYCSLVDHDSPELNSRITARKSKLLAIRDATIKELKSKQNRIRAEFIHTEITKLVSQDVDIYLCILMTIHQLHHIWRDTKM